jgi:hypothetical protein
LHKQGSQKSVSAAIAAKPADLSPNVAVTNLIVASPDNIGFGANGKIGKINRKAVSSAGRCLCPDVGGVHGNPQSEITTTLNTKPA